MSAGWVLSPKGIEPCDLLKLAHTISSHIWRHYMFHKADNTLRSWLIAISIVTSLRHLIQFGHSLWDGTIVRFNMRARPGRFLVGKGGWKWGIPGILSDSKWPFHRENYHQWVCHFHRRTMKNYIVMISQGVWGYLCFFLRHNPYPYGFIYFCMPISPLLQMIPARPLKVEAYCSWSEASRARLQHVRNWDTGGDWSAGFIWFYLHQIHSTWFEFWDTSLHHLYLAHHNPIISPKVWQQPGQLLGNHWPNFEAKLAGSTAGNLTGRQKWVNLGGLE
jgi:hypothetical protein